MFGSFSLVVWNANKNKICKREREVHTLERTVLAFLLDVEK